MGGSSTAWGRCFRGSWLALPYSGHWLVPPKPMGVGLSAIPRLPIRGWGRSSLSRRGVTPVLDPHYWAPGGCDKVL